MRLTRMNDTGIGLETGAYLSDAIKALYEIEETAEICGLRSVEEVRALMRELIRQDGQRRVRELIRAYWKREGEIWKRNRDRRCVFGVCGGCGNFVPNKPGARTGHCAVRLYRNRKGETDGTQLPVSYRRRRCRDDYVQKQELRGRNEKGD